MTTTAAPASTSSLTILLRALADTEDALRVCPDHLPDGTANLRRTALVRRQAAIIRALRRYRPPSYT